MGLFKTGTGWSSTCSQEKPEANTSFQGFFRSHQPEEPREQMNTKVFIAAELQSDVWGPTEVPPGGFRGDGGFNSRYKRSRECAELIKRIIHIFVEQFTTVDLLHRPEATAAVFWQPYWRPSASLAVLTYKVSACSLSPTSAHTHSMPGIQCVFNDRNVTNSVCLILNMNQSGQLLTACLMSSTQQD